MSSSTSTAVDGQRILLHAATHLPWITYAVLAAVVVLPILYALTLRAVDRRRSRLRGSP